MLFRSGYILCAFLSPETNLRDDRYGGSPENRARLVWEIIDGVRARTRPGFQLGLRLSSSWGSSQVGVADSHGSILRQWPGRAQFNE